MQIKHIISSIEEFAPPVLQESWDNTGLQVGDADMECTGVLLCLDVTPVIVEEARCKGCNLVISHHPLLFKGLKRISGNTPAEQSVICAIKNDIAIYSCHTAIDSAENGVSYELARLLGAKVTGTLRPAPEKLLQITVYAPRNKAQAVADALADIDLPKTLSQDIAESKYTYSEDSTGVPFVETTHVPLKSVSFTIPASQRTRVLRAIDGMGGDFSYTVCGIDNMDAGIGLGVIARYATPLSASDFISRVKQACGTEILRCSTLPERDIRTVAVCGGAGGEFIKTAAQMGVDAYITADVRYHDFAEWSERLFIIDAGHFETESCTKTLFMRLIKEKFANFAVYISETEKNPINYV